MFVFQQKFGAEEKSILPYDSNCMYIGLTWESLIQFLDTGQNSTRKISFNLSLALRHFFISVQRRRRLELARSKCEGYLPTTKNEVGVERYALQLA